MKFKSLLIALMLILFVSVNLEAAPKYSNSIGANPIGLAFGLFNATFETQLSPENSLVINGNYWSILDWTAFGFGGSYRWYIVKEPGKSIIEGFSFGPTVSIGFWKWGGYGSYSGSGTTSVAIGAEAAYKWVFGGFVVEPSLGFSFNAVSITGLNYPGFGLGCIIGYAW